MRNKFFSFKILFFLAVFFQIVLLVTVIGIKELRIRTGKKIIVDVFPRDPRSLFRGDYVDLEYSFSRIALAEVTHEDDSFYQGQRVYVKLRKDNISWQASALEKKPVSLLRDNEIVIAGKVKACANDAFVTIVYGVESYFVPQGQGKEIEENISQKKVKAQLSITKDGDASLCQLYINDTQFKFR